jgi:hypothetical protein
MYLILLFNQEKKKKKKKQPSTGLEYNHERLGLAYYL